LGPDSFGVIIDDAKARALHWGMKLIERYLRPFLANLAAVIIASVLFAASFPNLLVRDGLPVLAWVAFVPVFWLTRRVRIGPAILWGALYGYIAYGLFNYWLGNFHPLAGMIVGIIYSVYLAALFPLMTLSSRLFKRRGYIVQFLLWMGYEYLRTKGFLGYAYGISGYTQWNQVPLIQIADIFGVWGVSALVVFPSAWLAAALHHGKMGIKAFARAERLPAFIWVAAMAATLAYGQLARIDYTEAPLKRIALIQHNTDPWKGELQAYARNLRILRGLSLEALALEPKPDLVVWSETAFVPRIHWHSTYRENHDYYQLVKELLDFMAVQDVPFVVGNDDARKEANAAGELERVDYNAAILFDGGSEAGIYRKIHLVPFTEHFPYQKWLPGVYKLLSEADTHFWKKGTEATVFEAAGFRFSTPICFEDTFGYLSRRFVNAGADVIVNMTNDAWAHSLPSQMQHMSIAVFRAVENRRALVRATASGQTCAVDPNGRIIAMAEPFVETQLTVDVPIMKGKTFYTRFGDWLGVIFTAAAAAMLAIRMGGAMKRKFR
jgi:apolipoprotein N-acyltransferase